MSNTREAGMAYVGTVAQFHKAALERGDVSRISALSPMEVHGLCCYLATIDGIGSDAWLASYTLDPSLLTLVDAARQIGYLQCMDDLRNERIAI